MLKKIPENIIISRTDSIGDVVLTLPVAAVLKKNFPDIKVAFMGKSYTRPIIEACSYVDQFIDVKDFLKRRIKIGGKKPHAIVHELPSIPISLRALQIGIPLRIGTTNRFYHWGTCNEMVKLGRKNSSLHETQLNIKLLEPLGIATDFTLEELGHLFKLERIQPLNPDLEKLIDKNKYNLILHPKSQGSGREWPLDHYIQLVRQLDLQRYKIFISGTEKERPLLQPLFSEVGNLVTDNTGKMDLYQFISFINASDGLVASGTGPLHIAAALGKDALGIYPPLRPIHPGRWQPLGPHAKVFVLHKECVDCMGNKNACHCVREVQPSWLKAHLDKVSTGVVK